MDGGACGLQVHGVKKELDMTEVTEQAGHYNSVF